MKKAPGIFQYYVEGENERKLVDVLKTKMRLIIPGKVQILNVVQEKISEMKLRTLQPGTNLVFVFDTDVGEPTILKENIKKAQSSSNIKKVYCVPQVKNIEDELIRSTDLKSIEELLNSKSKTEFKRDMLRVSNLADKLESHQFDIQKLWVRNPGSPFDEICNDSAQIKF